MQAEYRKKMLFIDDAFVLQTHQLQRTVNQAVKHPQPLLRADAAWNGPNDVLDYISVLYDEQEKQFKMWYMVIQGQVDELEWDPHIFLWAYATSADGIHWERPILNLVEHNGTTENNYFLPAINGLIASIIIDPSDVPARRYKMLFVLAPTSTTNLRGKDLEPEITVNGMEWARFHLPVGIAYSADGLRWERPVHVNPVMRGLSDAGFVFHYDADRRKYVVVTRRVPNLPRDLSQYESFDLVNWEDKGRILVAPDELDPPSLFNLQAFAPFRYEDFYLGMLDVQYSLPGAESYEVFHKPPPDYPDQRLGFVEYQLAYSRDGQQWRRPADRSAVVPVGKPGAPDAGIIFCPLSSPFVVDGETYIYYTGIRNNHSHWSLLETYEQLKGNKRELNCVMLAKMPEDHWVSMDAGNEEGWLLMKPWHYPGVRMLVNADARGGAIAAELVTPYGEPVEGFTRADCTPVTGNGKDQEIRWRGMAGWNTAKFLDFATKEHRGGLLARIFVRNAKFYSCSVAEPDPDGSIGRHWANHRWCEHIKHRSDNWDRNSNEPALGLPPYSGPDLGER